MSAASTPLLSSPIETFVAATERNPVLPSRDATPNSSDEICFMRAVDILDAIRKKKLSAREVMQVHLKQINRVNAKVNAIVTLIPEEELMAQAAVADQALAKGQWLGAADRCQGPARNQGPPHHVWLSTAQRLCTGL
jgi:hypothetical protein